MSKQNRARAVVDENLATHANANTASDANTEAERMRDVVLAALAEAKGEQACALDVRALTDLTDYMVVVTGTSKRHIKTLAERVQEKMRVAGWKPFGLEGLDEGDGDSDSTDPTLGTPGDWVLVDFVDVVVHIMRATAREHYRLENLWDESMGEVLQASPDALGRREQQ